MMVRWSVADSSSGALVISTRSAFLAGGSTCAAAGWNASRLPTVVVIASVRSSAFMDGLVRGGRDTDGPSRVRRLAFCHYGIGIVGNGATPQIADAHCGSGGVGMIESFPWVAAVPPDMHIPVNVSRLGYGFVNPSVRVCRKATTWFSSWSVKPRSPVVMSILFLTSGIGQQVTFSTVPDGQCPDVTGKAIPGTSRVL